MKKSLFIVAALILSFLIFQSNSCDTTTPNTDNKVQAAQEQLITEANAQAGMPNIHNFTEKKMVKMLYELRDNPNLVNYAYLWSEVQGKWVYLGKCVGYGIPYSTQYSNPEKVVQDYSQSFGAIPQSEPNGLFMPSSSAGTWLMLVNPANPNDIKPVYVEPNLIVSPFKLPNQ